MNTGMMPVSKKHGGFVDCYESIIPNNLVEDVFLCCRNNFIQFLPVRDYRRIYTTFILGTAL